MINATVLWEACAGSAALSRALIGAPLRLVPQLGGKGRYATQLLAVAGLAPGQGVEALVWSDPGLWGLVWPELVSPERCLAVVQQLRAWARSAGDDDEGLWREILADPVPADRTAFTASFLVLQAGAIYGRPVEIRDERWWTAGFAHLTRGARQKGFRARLQVNLLADRIEAFARVPWPAVRVFHQRAQNVLHEVCTDLKGALVYIDGPYKLRGAVEVPRTGYADDLGLAEVCDLARHSADGGARVMLSEGGPLAAQLGPGWWSSEVLGGRGRKTGQEWVTANWRV